MSRAATQEHRSVYRVGGQTERGFCPYLLFCFPAWCTVLTLYSLQTQMGKVNCRVHLIANQTKSDSSGENPWLTSAEGGAVCGLKVWVTEQGCGSRKLNAVDAFQACKVRGAPK